MGSALITALSKSTRDILVSNRTQSKAKALAEDLGLAYGTNLDAAKADRIFLAVKPNMQRDVLNEILPIIRERKPVLISMAAGIEIKAIEEITGKLPIIRIMPNTPVLVGEGVIPYSVNELVDEGTEKSFINDMRFCGLIDKLDERLIDGACALSGCGPAYMYIFIEALADGGVACGLPRDKAIKYAAATMAGSAKTVLETSLHPEKLKDNVCSPGGSTIEGVKALEERGFRGAAMSAVISAYEKNKKLGK